MLQPIQTGPNQAGKEKVIELVFLNPDAAPHAGTESYTVSTKIGAEPSPSVALCCLLTVFSDLAVTQEERLAS